MFRRHKFLNRLVMIAFCLAGAAEASSTLLGDWSGVLNVDGMKLTLVLHVSQTDSDVLIGKLDVLEQNAKGIATDTLDFSNNVLKFSIGKIGASYHGELNHDGNEIVGDFTQGRGYPLRFTRGVMQPSAPAKRPQEPKPPFPYLEEQVTFKNPSANIELAGTLTVPFTKRPHKAVILITGSGPQDRDESIMGHKPFWVLADLLTRRGVAVLRVDDRGVGKSTGDFASAISDDFASDVLAGVNYLKTRKDINPKKIGLIGHSEGGIIAPMAAVKSKDIAFLVLMAGPGVNGEVTLYDQGARIMRADGASEETIARERGLREQFFEIVKREKDPSKADKELREVYANYVAALPIEEQKAAEAGADGAVGFVNKPWFRNFLVFEPKSVLEKIKIPVLAINGGLDLQVEPKQNLRAIAKALKKAGNRDYTTIELPGLNHLIQSAKTGSVREYAQIEETMSPKALRIIANWVLAH